MHHVAEYGVASHWLYKKGLTSEIVRPVDISIVNRLREWKQEDHGALSSDSFLEDIKRELLKDSIYVFTPQGQVIELPRGATAIDFAYHIHSQIGDHCMAAKANGTIIPLSRELRNTQVVEILTTVNARPHLNWLRLAKTAKARNKIRSWLQQHDEALIDTNVVAKKKPLEKAAPEEKDEKKDDRAFPPTEGKKVTVNDEKNLLIHFAQCCRPITGDPIIGYVSRGKGIAIHRKDCANLAGLSEFAQRSIEVEWEEAASALVKRFRVSARASEDLFAEIEGSIRKYQGRLIEGRLEETAANRLTGFFTMQLEQADDLSQIMKNIRSIPAVFSIQLLA
jgi:GTP pyrophosphokinase